MYVLQLSSSLDTIYNSRALFFTLGRVSYHSVIPVHCNLLDFVTYVPCHISFSQSEKYIHVILCQSMYTVNLEAKCVTNNYSVLCWQSRGTIDTINIWCLHFSYIIHVTRKKDKKKSECLSSLCEQYIVIHADKASNNRFYVHKKYY